MSIIYSVVVSISVDVLDDVSGVVVYVLSSSSNGSV